MCSSYTSVFLVRGINMTIFNIVLDGQSTPIYARKISDSCVQQFGAANVVYEIDLDPNADIVLVTFAHNLFVSHSTFVLPTLGNRTTFDLSMNPQLLDIRDKTKLYFSSRSDGDISFEFYKILGIS